MVSAPPAYAEPPVFRVPIGRGQVLSREDGHRPSGLPEHASAHCMPDRVGLPDRVAELSHVKRLVHIDTVVNEVGEHPAQRRQIRGGIEDEHFARQERFREVDVGAVRHQPSPTLPWLSPKPRIGPVLLAKLGSQQLDEVSQCPNRYLRSQSRSASAVECPGALELVPPTMRLLGA